MKTLEFKFYLFIDSENFKTGYSLISNLRTLDLLKAFKYYDSSATLSLIKSFCELSKFILINMKKY